MLLFLLLSQVDALGKAASFLWTRLPSYKM